jgi:hypothetical protein
MPNITELQALLLQAQRALGKLSEEPIVRDGFVDTDPRDLDDLAELSEVLGKSLDPVIKHIAWLGDLAETVKRRDLFNTLVSDHINDYVASGLRKKAQDIREDTEPGMGSDRADYEWANRHEEPVI